MGNKELKEKYNEMHARGPTSWSSDGKNERDMILRMGEPWKGLSVLEIGCGEGDLAEEISKCLSNVTAIDYSYVSIEKARRKYPGLKLSCVDYKDMAGRFDRIVMQGVMEHLDRPFHELKWMMENFLLNGGSVITSSPCHLNPFGIVWMTCEMFGAVMSKTDLHYINEWDMKSFSENNHWRMQVQYTDGSRGYGEEMISDLRNRIVHGCKDAHIPLNHLKKDKLLDWLEMASRYGIHMGATAVYKIQT